MKRQKKSATKAMRVASGEHQPSDTSKFGMKKVRRAQYARATGYDVGTPFPAMGIKDSRGVAIPAVEQKTQP